MRIFRRSACVALCVLLCLCVFAPRAFAVGDATAFLAAVREIDETETYDERAAVLARANALYDESFAEAPGVAAAKARLDAEAAALARVQTAAQAYIAAAERAVEAHERQDYSATVAALDEADENYAAAVAIPGYNGVAAAKYNRDRIREELYEPEEAARNYIAAAGELDTCTTYEAVTACLSRMQTFAEEMVSDYPGVAEATARYREAEEFLDACERTAGTFILAVAQAADADHYDAAELLRLLRMRRDVDLTCDGARDANSTLSYLVREYNKLVKAANAAAEEMLSLSMTLGMAGGDRKISQNVTELLK